MFRCSVKIKCFESPTFSFRLRNTSIVYKRSDIIATVKFKKFAGIKIIREVIFMRK